LPSFTEDILTTYGIARGEYPRVREIKVVDSCSTKPCECFSTFREHHILSPSSNYRNAPSVNIYQNERLLILFYLEDGSATAFRNVSKYLPDQTEAIFNTEDKTTFIRIVIKHECLPTASVV
jgi:hypothetical protein